MSRATQSGVVTVRRRVDDEARAVKPPYEFSQREGGLEPREGGAEAVVDAAAEAEMLIVGARGVAETAAGLSGKPATSRGSTTSVHSSGSSTASPDRP